MQQLIEALGGAGGIAQMAKELGVNEQMVAKGASALLPALLGGFKQQAASGSLDGLVGMLGQMGGGSLLDQVLGSNPTPVSQGNAILGQIFGSPDVSRTVADQAAAQTGLSPQLLKSMLPMLAMAAAGFMARQANAGAASEGGPGGGLGGLVGSVMSALTGGGAQSSLGAGGLGQIASLLDLDKDGNPLDDILGMAGKLTGR